MVGISAGIARVAHALRLISSRRRYGFRDDRTARFERCGFIHIHLDGDQHHHIPQRCGQAVGAELDWTQRGLFSRML